jgi:two-component system, NarL family, sensor kinase
MTEGQDEAALRAEIEELRAELAAAREELADRRQFVSQVMDAENRARRRIAQLIHDDALQSLLAANQELMEAAPGRAGVTRAHEVVSASIADLREALLALHPVTLEQGGLEQAVGAVARQAERQGGFRVDVELDAGAAAGHDELILAVARELLTNAIHHSGAESVRMRVTALDGGGVELEIADDGRGMEPSRPREALASGHIGLASVVQRAEAVGGEFEMDTKPGKGTTVRIRLPAAQSGEPT